MNMNVMALCHPVALRTTRSPEADLIEATLKANALSSANSKALQALNKLLWSLGSGSSDEEVDSLASAWVEAVEEGGLPDDADPQSIANKLLSGARACSDNDGRAFARRH